MRGNILFLAVLLIFFVTIPISSAAEDVYNDVYEISHDYSGNHANLYISGYVSGYSSTEEYPRG